MLPSVLNLSGQGKKKGQDRNGPDRVWTLNWLDYVRLAYQNILDYLKHDLYEHYLTKHTLSGFSLSFGQFSFVCFETSYLLSRKGLQLKYQTKRTQHDNLLQKYN